MNQKDGGKIKKKEEERHNNMEEGIRVGGNELERVIPYKNEGGMKKRRLGNGNKRRQTRQNKQEIERNRVRKKDWQTKRIRPESIRMKKRQAEVKNLNLKHKKP